MFVDAFAATWHSIHGSMYLEISLSAPAKVVDILNDCAPHAFILIVHWVESCPSCLDDSILGSVVLVAHDEEVYSGDLAIQVILLVLVYGRTLAIIGAGIAAVEARMTTAGFLSGRLPQV